MTFDATRPLESLGLLYGASAGAVLERWEALLERHRRRLTGRPIPPPVDHADVFLIAYPDQLREPGRAPLAVLRDFARSRASPFTGLHLLPFFPSSSDDGFSVTDYRRVDPVYGDWDDVGALAGDFRLMVDLVLNHASARSAWFEAFRRRVAPYASYFRVPEPDGDWSQVVRPRTTPLFTEVDTRDGPARVWTTFGPDQVDLDYREPAVLLEMVDLLLEYVARGAQVIRLDAVAYLWKQSGTSCLHLPQTHAIVRLLRQAVRALAPGVRLITETNVPHADNVRYFGDGHEADWVYAFPLPPLVLHTLTTGDATALTDWLHELRSPPGDGAYFNFLASHDGLGLNGASGLLSEAEIETLVRLAERCGSVSYRSQSSGAPRPYELNANLLDLLGGVPPDAPLPPSAVPRMICAHAILLALAGIPAVYFHSLVGSRGDAEAARRTGHPRAINRQKMERAALEAELDDSRSARRRILDGIERVIRARRSLPALDPLAAQRALRLGPGIVAVERVSRDGSQRLVCVHEVAGRETVARAVPHGAAGRDVLTGETASLDGLDLAPYQARWIEVVP